MENPIQNDVSLQAGPQDPEKAALFETVTPVAAIPQTPEELLAELTLEEKVSLLSGVDFRTTPGVARLGISRLCVRISLTGEAVKVAPELEVQMAKTSNRQVMVSMECGQRPTIVI